MMFFLQACSDLVMLWLFGAVIEQSNHAKLRKVFLTSSWQQLVPSLLSNQRLRPHLLSLLRMGPFSCHGMKCQHHHSNRKAFCPSLYVSPAFPSSPPFASLLFPLPSLCLTLLLHLPPHPLPLSHCPFPFSVIFDRESVAEPFYSRSSQSSFFPLTLDPVLVSGTVAAMLPLPNGVSGPCLEL